MKTLLLALPVLATTLTAAAQPAPAPTPPGPPDTKMIMPRCTPYGRPVFEIDRGSLNGSDAGFPSSEAKLFANGTYSIVEHVDGKVTRETSGCFDTRLSGAVTKMLDTAPWKLEHNAIRCAAASFDKTAYKVRGKLVFTAITCGDDRLDDVSAAHLADAEAFLDALTANVTPPCCKP